MTLRDTSSNTPDYVEQGYRIVSRKYGTIARIDRDDWLELLLEKYPNWQAKKGGLNTASITLVQAADHYRRCFSKDTIDLGRKALTLKIPNSGDMV